MDAFGKNTPDWERENVGHVRQAVLEFCGKSGNRVCTRGRVSLCIYLNVHRRPINRDRTYVRFLGMAGIFGDLFFHRGDLDGEIFQALAV